jgi:hypothetical protein
MPSRPRPPTTTGRQLADFGDLLPAEQELVAACREGRPAVVGTGERPDEAADAIRIRAGVLRVLCLGRDPQAPVHEWGVFVRGAWIDGDLDLNDCTVPHPLVIIRCHVEGDVRLSRAAVKLLHLAGSRVGALSADGLRGDDDVNLCDGFVAKREVRFLGASIGGDLNCSGARFVASEGVALGFDRAKIAGSVFLNNNFVAKGTVHFLGASIGGNLACPGASFEASEGDALSFDGAKIAGGVFLNKNLVARNPVRFLDATIGGVLTCSGASFEASKGNALNFDGATISGDVFLEENFVAKSTVRFLGATIGGNLECSGASFAASEGIALGFDRAKIVGSVFLKMGFVAKREVRFLGASIGGNLDCSGASFEASEGDALDFDGVTISGDVFLNDSCVAKSTVRFLGATIGGDLTCSGASFAASEGDALNFDRATISGGVFLNENFVAKSTVRFLGATIGGDLTCSGASFAASEGVALGFDRATIAGDVFLNETFVARGTVRFLGASIGGDLACRKGDFTTLSLSRAAVRGTVFLDDDFQASEQIDLRHAEIGVLVDTPAAWAAPTLVLDGLTWHRFGGGAPVDAAARILWLEQQPAPHLGKDFRPQPWEQCAKVLAEMGHDRDAVKLRIEKRRRMRWLDWQRAKNGDAAPGRNRLRRLWYKARCSAGALGDIVLSWTIGYGYKPHWAAGWMIAVWLVAAGVYAYAVPAGVMAPTDPLVYLSPTIPSECRDDWLTFDPPTRPDDLGHRFARSVELGLPVDDIGSLPTAAGWPTICPRLMPAEYTTFSSMTYALDLLLPIIDLRQEKDWAPRVTDAKGDVLAPLWPGAAWGWGHVTRLGEWLLILVGWGLSAVFVGAVTGLIRRD